MAFAPRPTLIIGRWKHMSETSDPTTGPEQTTPPAGADAVTPDPGRPGRWPHRPGPGSTPATARPFPCRRRAAPRARTARPGSPGAWDPARPHRPPATVGTGAPTPPAGVWAPASRVRMGPRPSGGAPSYLGWPPAGPGAPVAPSAPKRSNGLMMALATVAVVVAVVAGVGLGHVVWPTGSTAAVSASPAPVRAAAPAPRGAVRRRSGPVGGQQLVRVR